MHFLHYTDPPEGEILFAMKVELNLFILTLFRVSLRLSRLCRNVRYVQFVSFMEIGLVRSRVPVCLVSNENLPHFYVDRRCKNPFC